MMLGFGDDDGTLKLLDLLCWDLDWNIIDFF
jgi:hypothetical protein